MQSPVSNRRGSLSAWIEFNLKRSAVASVSNVPMPPRGRRIKKNPAVLSTVKYVLLLLGAVLLFLFTNPVNIVDIWLVLTNY